MAALTARLTVLGDPATDPEDILSSSLAAIYPDDVANTHGDAAHALHYASPHLPRPLLLQLADPQAEAHRRLFSHYLWNAALLLAELVESATLGVPLSCGSGLGGGLGDVLTSSTSVASVKLTEGQRDANGGDDDDDGNGYLRHFNVRNQRCIELGAGTALPSLMAALLGARHVTITDYPSAEFLETVRRNVAHNVRPEFSPLSTGDARGVEGKDVGEEEHKGGDGEAGSISASASVPRTEADSAKETRKNGTSANALATVQVFGHEWGVLPDNDNTLGTTATREDNVNVQEDHVSDDEQNGEGPKPSSLVAEHHHTYDRVIAADCLWMSSQHANLAASISWLLRRPGSLRTGQRSTQQNHQHGNGAVDEREERGDEDSGGRALIVAGFHTGRQGMRGFLFSPPDNPSPVTSEERVVEVSPEQHKEHLRPSAHLLENGLEVESIHERDCDGNIRPWAWDRGYEDPSERKRWLVVAVLRPAQRASS